MSFKLCSLSRKNNLISFMGLHENLYLNHIYYSYLLTLFFIIEYAVEVVLIIYPLSLWCTRKPRQNGVGKQRYSIEEFKKLGAFSQIAFQLSTCEYRKKKYKLLFKPPRLKNLRSTEKEWAAYWGCVSILYRGIPRTILMWLGMTTGLDQVILHLA